MKTFLLCFFALSIGSFSFAQQRPYDSCRRCFPFSKNVHYHEASNPDLTTITSADLHILFHDWDSVYVVHLADGTAYIKNDEQDVGEDGITTSEGNGYGMVIEALMAGCQANAQKQFDALYGYALKHHIASKNPDDGFTSPYLMSWKQYDTTSTKKDEKDAAVDGDLDIAYALLLAYVQWGDSGHYHYLDAARETLHAIIQYETDVVSLKFERGSDDNLDNTKPAYHFLRTSDFMPVNIRAFAACSTDPAFWNAFLKANYDRFRSIQSKQYGLFPDYVYEEKPGTDFVITKDNRRLARGQHLNDGGGKRDNKYGANCGFNACRVPWRIGLDYLLTGSMDAKGIIDNLNSGIRRYTLDTACLLSNVMLPSDNGDTSAHHRYVDSAADKESADISTVAPLALTAMADDDLAWRRALLQQLTDQRATMCFNADPAKLGQHKYYETTIRIICDIIITHNYWTFDAADLKSADR